MIRSSILGLALAFAISSAMADDHFTKSAPGTDLKVVPSELTVFVARTADLGPWPANVFPAIPDMPNLDWVREQDTGLKICRRSYVYIEDQTALVHPEILPMHPDTTRLETCAKMGMMIDHDKLIGNGSSWYVDMIACPERILDEHQRTVFKKPDCPMDCHCINEPEDM